MRYYFLLICICMTFTSTAKNIQLDEFQKILDSLDLTGSILIFDDANSTYYSNDFEWSNKGFIPASTYKIPNTIIGLELGTLKDEQELFHWDGQKRRFPQWEKDMNLKEAFKVSCLPCYQELARKNGLKGMKKMSKKINYGSMKIHKKTLDNFWLKGQSKISPFQQIDFLRRLYHQELPIQQKTYDIMSDIMIHAIKGQKILRGKTGWGDEKGKDLGWFVGYVVHGEKVYFFATCVQPKNEDVGNFLQSRIDATLAALQHLDIF